MYKKGYHEKDVSPSKLLAELGWKTLSQRRKEQRLTMLYKILNGLVAIPPTHLVKPARKLKGHSKKLQELGSSCDTVKHSFYVRTIRQWNELTEERVSSPSLDSFKSNLSKH